jgi:hypothetical protein
MLSERQELRENGVDGWLFTEATPSLMKILCVSYSFLRCAGIESANSMRDVPYHQECSHGSRQTSAAYASRTQSSLGRGIVNKAKSE